MLAVSITVSYGSDMKNLARYGVSYKIARAGGVLEGGPEAEAQLTYSGMIHDTWGGYASRLIEYWGERGVDMSLDDVCSALFITPADIRDDGKIQFTHFGYDTFSGKVRALIRDRVTEQCQPEVERLRQKVAEIAQQFTIDPDEVSVRFDGIVSDIEAVENSDEYRQLLEKQRAYDKAQETYFYESIGAETTEAYEEAENKRKTLKVERRPTDNRIYEYDMQVALLGLERDAVESGVAVTLDKFIQIIYEAELGESPLAQAWISALGETVDNILYNTPVDKETTKVSSVYVGQDAFDLFSDSISAHQLARDTGEAHLAFIRPAFFSDITIDTHPLITGQGEK